MAVSFFYPFVLPFLSKKYPFGDFTNPVKCVMMYTGEKGKMKISHMRGYQAYV